MSSPLTHSTHNLIALTVAPVVYAVQINNPFSFPTNPFQCKYCTLYNKIDSDLNSPILVAVPVSKSKLSTTPPYGIETIPYCKSSHIYGFLIGRLINGKDRYRHSTNCSHLHPNIHVEMSI